MVALTLTDYNEAASPGEEVVQLTGDDADTYISRKFDVILAIDVCKNSNDNEHINATWTGNTVTINYNSGSSDKVSLTIYGKTGP